MKKHIMYAVLAALSLAVYVATSELKYRIGFPLDDAWIHQTYARSLGTSGEWAFWPGRSSAGSTAPLWTTLLALGHVLHIEPLAWAFFLGWAGLWTVMELGAATLRSWLPEGTGQETWAIAGGGALALEWHLSWAAGSGMETLLFTVLVLLLLVLVSRPGRVSWFWVGLLVGLCAWVRPDGITLLGPALVCVFGRRFRKTLFHPRNPVLSNRVSESVRDLGVLLLGFALAFGPYLLFNWALAGSPWPNTFFAKQAEYAVLRQAQLVKRFLVIGLQPLVGAGAVLLPGAAFFVMRALRQRQWEAPAAAAWALGYLGLYTWRLPVAYQHGRYVMPVAPILLLLGVAGMAGLVQTREPQILKRVLGKAWTLSVALILLLFWIRGASAFAEDVAFIESEMVVIAHRVAKYTEPGALVAAHDIGALGYFSQRRLIDLAGLISPEVIPFIRDEARLAQFLDVQGAEYLVTFPGWYPELVQDIESLYCTGGRFSPEAGGENMCIYRWERKVRSTTGTDSIPR